MSRLSDLAGFHPAERVALALNYHIDVWIEPAFRQLIAIPTDEFDYGHIDRIGLRAYGTLTRVKWKIDEHHRVMAFSPPAAVRGDECLSPNYCSFSWEKERKEGVAIQILHPDVRRSGPHILAALRDIRLPGVCLSCQTATLRFLEESGGLVQENRLIDDAVRELIHAM
jgi:hypothetical protein